jgi:hypothetical protein
VDGVKGVKVGVGARGTRGARKDGVWRVRGGGGRCKMQDHRCGYIINGFTIHR